MELCLFGARGREIDRIDMRWQTDHIFHSYLPGLAPGALYGLRAYGPYDPNRGLRFNHHKLLLDPYARDWAGTVELSDAHFGYRIGHKKADLGFDVRNNAALMPKCRVVDSGFDWQGDRAPRIPWSETVLYEVHVKGLTRRHPALPEPHRGTYLGLSHPEVIGHLKRIGVTAVELLPVHSILHERRLREQGLANYWGYGTIGYFRPEAGYAASDDPVREFKSMVRALHREGLEVILDVVYNHTGEGSELGPTLCFRGLDNPSYYRLDGHARYYRDCTGCGNTVNTDHPQVLQLIMDSLRYWVEEMHVDGFRYDLATALARDRSSFLDAIHQDPVLSRVKLIAEPWDLGESGYQAGNFPPGWSEWNDRYRDTLRSFWKGDPGQVPRLAARLTGSADLYAGNGRKPGASINFVTCHDGFTLADLVAYDHKHNLANAEENRDGSNHNISWNCGLEGDTPDPQVLGLRAQQQRNFLASLFCSQGVPMLLGGDEIGRSQGGNNNAYCQDNEVSWFDWDLDHDHELLRDYVAHLAALRRSHPHLRRRTFPGPEQAFWLHPRGGQMREEDWSDSDLHSLGLYYPGRAAGDLDPHGQPVVDDDLLLIFHAGSRGLEFQVGRYPGRSGWRVLLDTGQSCGHEEALRNWPLVLRPHATVVLARPAGGVRDRKK